MTRDKGFAYFQEVMVYKKNKMYVVTLEEEEATFYLEPNMINQIAKKANEEENLVAILVAYINYVRRSRAKCDGKRDGRPQNLDSQVIVDGLITILKKVSIDDLIVTFRSLKWHEIKSILTFDLPIEEVM